MPAKRALIMHPSDNVATSVEEIQPGESVAIPAGRDMLSLNAAEAIPFGFKIALQEIPQGGIIRKYGETIGKASVLIAKGSAELGIREIVGLPATSGRRRRWLRTILLRHGAILNTMQIPPFVALLLAPEARELDNGDGPQLGSHADRRSLVAGPMAASRAGAHDGARYPAIRRAGGASLWGTN